MKAAKSCHECNENTDYRIDILTSESTSLAVWYKTKFDSQIVAIIFGVFFLNICNLFKSMFNVALMIMW